MSYHIIFQTISIKDRKKNLMKLHLQFKIVLNNFLIKNYQFIVLYIVLLKLFSTQIKINIDTFVRSFVRSRRPAARFNLSFSALLNHGIFYLIHNSLFPSIVILFYLIHNSLFPSIVI
jgi:hypothetical protein